MNTKLILILAVLAGASALPIRADVTVTESARVLKDGNDIGAVPDAVKNGIVTPSEVQAALLKLIVSMKAEREAAQTEATAAKADKAKIVEAVAKDDKKAIAEAVKSEKQRQKDALAAEIAAKQAELDKLK